MMMMSIRLTLSQHLVYPDANAFVLQLSVSFIIDDNVHMEDYQRISPPCVCLRVAYVLIQQIFAQNRREDRENHDFATQMHFYSLNLITHDTNEDVTGKYGYSNQPLHNIIHERHARERIIYKNNFNFFRRMSP